MKHFLKYLASEGMSEADYKAKTADEQQELFMKWQDQSIDNLEKSVKETVSSANFEKLQKEFKAVKDAQSEFKPAEMSKVIKDLQAKIKEYEDNGNGAGSQKVNAVKEFLEANKDKIKELKEDRSGNISFDVDKATQTYTDISGRDELTPVEAGIGRKPFRDFTILNLFRRKPLGREFLKYMEEDVVTRDGKVVVHCATSTHNTKKSFIIRTVETAKVKDKVDVCEDMLDDYSFMEDEIKMLVTEGVNAQEEVQILTSTNDGTGGTYLGLEAIASEFDATNALANYESKFASATITDLIGAMKGQIATFGAEKMWNPNIVLMNHNDYIVYKHGKDGDKNYLLPHLFANGGNNIDGLQVVTSPLIAQNTLFVFDSKQAVILDRQKTKVTMYFENKDNAENEIVLIKALKRSQLHVKNINRDAFMKCSNVSTALTDISI